MFLFSLLRGGADASTIIVSVLALAIAVVFAMSMHESAHALVAYKNGDPTAKALGRVTLNPIKHLDVTGFIMLLVVGFGWAKPVPIDPSRFKNRKKGMILTSIAGVVTNFVLALIFLLIFKLMIPLMGTVDITSGFSVVMADFVLKLLMYSIQINLMLMLFNLLPIYPLDGFRILNEFLPHGNRFSVFMYRYGSWVLMGLILFSYVCDMFGWWFLDIFGMFSDLIQNLIVAVMFL